MLSISYKSGERFGRSIKIDRLQAFTARKAKKFQTANHEDSTTEFQLKAQYCSVLISSKDGVEITV